MPLLALACSTETRPLEAVEARSTETRPLEAVEAQTALTPINPYGSGDPDKPKNDLKPWKLA